jgi:hypothetical protein
MSQSGVAFTESTVHLLGPDGQEVDMAIDAAGGDVLFVHPIDHGRYRHLFSPAEARAVAGQLLAAAGVAEDQRK